MDSRIPFQRTDVEVIHLFQGHGQVAQVITYRHQVVQKLKEREKNTQRDKMTCSALDSIHEPVFCHKPTPQPILHYCLTQ